MLANATWGLIIPGIQRITGEIQYVPDGDTLLQRIPWTQGATYHDLCIVYTDYVSRKYGEAILSLVAMVKHPQKT